MEKPKFDNRTKQNHLAKQRAMWEESKNWPKELTEMDIWNLPKDPRVTVVPFRALRSRDFLVQLFQEYPGIVRMTVCRTIMDKHGNLKDGITIEELMRLKREAGYGEKDATEVLPRDTDWVDIANMRHVWIFDEPVPYAWRNGVSLPEWERSGKKDHAINDNTRTSIDGQESDREETDGQEAGGQEATEALLAHR